VAADPAGRPPKDQQPGDPDVGAFLANLAQVLAASSAEEPVRAMAVRIRSAAERAGERGNARPSRLPVCSNLASAISAAAATSPGIARLADSFAAIEPFLNWARRPAGGPFASDNWLKGHANATIVGANGLESRGALQVGASLMAPEVRYPDHSHQPEEVYLALSPGWFKHGTSSWVEPGIGGTFHNVPNIQHAMASDGAPFLAIWCLWDGARQ